MTLNPVPAVANSSQRIDHMFAVHLIVNIAMGAGLDHAIEALLRHRVTGHKQAHFRKTINHLPDEIFKCVRLGFILQE